MSKELEALKRLGALEIGISNNGHLVKHAHDTLEYNTLLQALTPPTADEVCEAISDYLDLDFFYTKCVFKDNAFREECGGELIEVLIDYQNVIYFYVDLPPHIVEMVARFYKGLTK